MAVYLMTWIDTNGKQHSKGTMCSSEFMEKANIGTVVEASMAMDMLVATGYINIANTTNGTWCKLEKAKLNENGEVVTK